MFGLSPWHLLIVLVVVLLVLGPGRLPETGAALGKAIRGFREGIDGRGAGPTQEAGRTDEASVREGPR